MRPFLFIPLMPGLLLGVIQFFAAPEIASPLDPGQTGKIRVLFVGNSYTYADDIPWITTQLAASRKDPNTLEVKMIALPGATLQSHWEKGEVVTRLHQGKW